MRLPATTLTASALAMHVLVRALVFHVLVLVQVEVSAENEFSAEGVATT
jgi:hypothetical protein